MKLSNPNVKGKGRTASREVRRRQLIEATIDSIAERGLSETTLATVTNGAKLSHGIVNFHFKSKELLFAETLEFLVEEHHDLWRGTLDRPNSTPLDKLLALVDADFHPTICSRKKIAVWFAFYGEARYRTAYRDKCARIDDDRVKETEKLCQLIKDEGGYDHFDPRMVAQSLEALIDGLWLNMLLYPDLFTPEAAREECLAYLEMTFPRHFPESADSQACKAR